MAPSTGIDPFSTAFLTSPWQYHAGLRDAGPVVWLECLKVWGMARYDEVHRALLDWQTYSSAAGVGLSNFRHETPWRNPSLLLEADPPAHTRARKAVSAALSPRTVRELAGYLTHRATALAARLVDRKQVDGVCDIAEAFPLEVFPAAVGMASTP